MQHLASEVRDLLQHTSGLPDFYEALEEPGGMLRYGIPAYRLPREIIQAALRFNASSLIFVHNHPSGDPGPSESDREITKELIFAVQLMQIKVLDHIIIGNNRYFSFADQGLIQEYEILFQRIKKT